MGGGGSAQFLPQALSFLVTPLISPMTLRSLLGYQELLNSEHICNVLSLQLHHKKPRWERRISKTRNLYAQSCNQRSESQAGISLTPRHTTSARGNAGSFHLIPPHPTDRHMSVCTLLIKVRNKILYLITDGDLRWWFWQWLGGKTRRNCRSVSFLKFI
jgi:hypothetical protein